MMNYYTCMLLILQILVTQLNDKNCKITQKVHICKCFLLKLHFHLYFHKRLGDHLNRIIEPKAIDSIMITCEAPNCSKPITSKLLTCGVCNKKIHAYCDPKTQVMKQKTINKINFYCSFHGQLGMQLTLIIIHGLICYYNL